jgi:outer membrane lipoprotein-sorting protein
MNRHDHEEDLLDRATRAMREAPELGELPGEMLLQRIAASRDAAARQPHWIISRIRSMKTISKVAASVLIALCLAGAGWVMLNATPALAFASVVQQLHDAHTVTSELIIQQGGMSVKGKMMYMSPGHFRTDMVGGPPEIVDLQAGRIVLLDDVHKNAIVMKIEQQDQSAAAAAASVDWFEQLRNIGRNAGKPLGETEINGVRAQQFNVQENGQPMTIFADAKTGAPLRIETTVKMGDKTIAVTLDQLVLDAPLAESLFSTAVPAGYTQQEASVSGAAYGEADVVKFLGDYADRTGVFPPSIGDMNKALEPVSNQIKARRQNMPNQGNTLPPADFMQFMVNAGRALMFVKQLPASADWHYAGAGVKKGDAGKAVFWYHAKDSGSYRVVYADLHVADVPTAGAPQDAGAEKQISK